MRYYLICLLALLSIGSQAQTYPFADDFESYTNYANLGTQGGYVSDMQVYPTHGYSGSKGLTAQMTNFNAKDTAVSPLIGPITSSSQLSFYYRVMQTGALYSLSASLYTGDSIIVAIGSASFGVYNNVYTITSANHVVSTAFKKITIPVGSVAGQSGNLRITVKHPSNGNDFFFDLDSLVVRDTAAVVGNPPTVTVASIDTVSCNGGINGGAHLTVTGGTAPYTYDWSNGTHNASLTGVAAGTYSVTVHDNAGATATASVTVVQPAALSVIFSNATNANCNGGSNGAATAIPSGGTPSYTYNWSTSPAQTTATASNLAAGSYSVTVTDHHSCTATSSVTITQPSAVTVTTSSTASGCTTASGTATVTPSGGTPGYTYTWNTTPPQTTATATALAGGSYSVTVKDNNNCSATASVTVTQSSGLSITSTVDSIKCSGGTGSISIVAAGGTPAYVYAWAGTSSTSSTSGAISGGSYSVTVTDAGNCTATASFSVTSPAAIVITDSVVDASSATATDGAIFTSASGGTPGYTYQFSNGANISSAQDVTQGCYSITVTDANNCTATKDSLCVGVATGIESITLNQLSAYPIPTSNTLTVTIPQSNANAELILIDALGRVMLRSDVTGKVQATLDVANIAEGFHLLMLTIDNKLASKVPVVIGR